MKYILIEHSDGNDPKQLRIFDTMDARASATREAILGTTSDKDEPCPELLELATEGIVHFEGDPSLEWIDAEVTIVKLTSRLKRKDRKWAKLVDADWAYLIEDRLALRAAIEQRLLTEERLLRLAKEADDRHDVSYHRGFQNALLWLLTDCENKWPNGGVPMTDKDVWEFAIAEGWKPADESGVSDAISYLSKNGHKLYEIEPENDPSRDTTGPR